MGGYVKFFLVVITLSLFAFGAGMQINNYKQETWGEAGVKLSGRVNVEWLYEASGQDLSQLCSGELGLFAEIRDTPAGEVQVMCPRFNQPLQYILPIYDTIPISRAASDSIIKLHSDIK